MGGQRHKMPRHRLGLLGSRQCGRLRHEPLPGRMGIQHGLGRGERFGGHDEQRVLGTHLVQHMAQLMAIDIGDKVKALASRHPIFQSIDCYFRSQVRTSDTNVDHVGDCRVRTHALGQRQHGIQGCMHILQRPLQLQVVGHQLMQSPAIGRHA